MKSTDKKSIRNKSENEIIESRIRNAVEHASTGNFGDVLERCDNLKGVIPMEKNRRSNTKKHLSIAAAFVILVTAILGITFLQKPKAVSLVSLDVNPSIMLEVDEDNRIDDVTAVNEDGKKILGDMKLENTDVDVALRALVGSMLENGYIDELANSILVSVDDTNATRAAELEQHIVSELDKILTDNIDSSNVIGQVMHDDDAALSALAEQFGISKGKAEYINSIIDDNPQLTFEKLAPLSINDISLLISENKQVSAPKNVDQKGVASEKAYIGRDKALENALISIGVAKTDIRNIEVDLDYDNGRMIYEVDFDYGTVEYEIDIDAKSGEIIKTSKDTNNDITVPATNVTQEKNNNDLDNIYDHDDYHDNDHDDHDDHDDDHDDHDDHDNHDD